MKKNVVIFLVFTFSICNLLAQPCSAQNLPIYDSLIREIGSDSILYHEVERYKQLGFTDRKVLFAGSSTFAGWRNLEQTFEKYDATNRAIGGMVLSQVIWHSEALIFKNKPQILVFYIGDNDALRYDYPTFERYMKCFVDNFIYRQPNSKLILVSVKPSPSRNDKFDFYLKINSYLKQLANERKEVRFVDIWSPIATSGDEKSYFQSDMLHLNNKGNEVIVELLTPLLEEFINQKHER